MTHKTKFNGSYIDDNNDLPFPKFLTDEEIAALPAEQKRLWKNKKLVRDFFYRLHDNRDLTAADDYLSPDYFQHNPNIVTGREGFKAYFRNLFRMFSKNRLDMLMFFAEGDIVITYSEYDASNVLMHLRMKFIDIWRIENGKIVEHWDAVQGRGLKDALILAFQPQPNKKNAWWT